MCGINGIIKFDGSVVAKDEISVMNEKIKHRGPDDQGVFVDGNIGLGHVRLSIMDLSSRGHQPMFFEKDGKKFAIVFNGEIYNFPELKKELQENGYEFNSTTDTEVILAAYHKWGKECIKKFNGMFAFVIYDPQRNILFGARDRFGKKPLKYYLDDSNFVFSSELKAILTQGMQREVDLEAVNDYLTLQYVPAPKTGFKNIFKLPHASYFVFDLGNKVLKTKKYWDLDYSQKPKMPKKELAKELERRLDESVKRRMIADVEIGAFLSGGVDSSAVVAFASKYKEKLKTFTIKFDEKDFDESEYAKKVAKRYNTDHHEFLVKADDMKGYIEFLVEQYEEPYADSSQLPTYILSKKTSEFVKVVLNGDGGDENFGGYDKYQRHLAVPFLRWLPWKNFLARQFLKHSQKRNSFKLYKYYLFLKTLDFEVVRRHFNYTHYFDVFYKEDFYKDEYKEKFKELQYKSFEKFARKNIANELDQVFFLDFNTYVPDDLMVKVDIATMANGLESRSPLLDYEFVEFCAKIKNSNKIDIFGKRKKIFKKMLERHVDEDILYRKKKGFSVPIKHWLTNELEDYMRQTILNENGLVLKLMKKDKIENLLKIHKEKKSDHSRKLWILMSLNLWHKEYFNEI